MKKEIAELASHFHLIAEKLTLNIFIPTSTPQG